MSRVCKAGSKYYLHMQVEMFNKVHRLHPLPDWDVTVKSVTGGRKLSLIIHLVSLSVCWSVLTAVLVYETKQVTTMFSWPYNRLGRF